MPSLFPNEALVSDPIPHRDGQWSAGMLTAAEFAAVKKFLAEVERTRPALITDRDLWVAFGSLLRGGYISETFPGSGMYALTRKGAIYRRQLGIGGHRA